MVSLPVVNRFLGNLLKFIALSKKRSYYAIPEVHHFHKNVTIRPFIFP